MNTNHAECISCAHGEATSSGILEDLDGLINGGEDAYCGISRLSDRDGVIDEFSEILGQDGHIDVGRWHETLDVSKELVLLVGGGRALAATRVLVVSTAHDCDVDRLRPEISHVRCAAARRPRRQALKHVL
jgi:hypothetical protein